MNRNRIQFRAAAPGAEGPRRGVVLIIVLVVVVVLSLAAYAFTELMLTHREATEYAGRQAQARLLVDSGVDSIRVFLMKDRDTQKEAGGIFDNPTSFQAQLVVDDPDPNLRGLFTVMAPLLDDQGYPGGLRYGLENESDRVNINALIWLETQPGMEGAGRNLLMALPNMTEEIADAIMDYVDDNFEPREFGAEDDYYLDLDPPYAAKNGPLETVEELLLVRGVTPQLLFGADVNRNGLMDPGEQAAAAEGEATMTDATVLESSNGSMDRGWSAYLTLWSMERNVNAQGEPRICVNQDDLEQLHEQLSAYFDATWVNFIIAYRQYGPNGGAAGAAAGAAGAGANSGTPSNPASAIVLDLTQPAQFKINQILELIGAQVNIPGTPGSGTGAGTGGGGGNATGGGGGNSTLYDSPFASGLLEMASYLPTLQDQVSVNPSVWIPGRININEAPRAILVGIPGMTEELADQIISNRMRPGEEEEEDPNRRFETWIMTTGLATLQEMRTLTPFISGGGDVYRAQVVGYFEDGAASARTEVVIDATQSTPRILFWRDLTHLGRGYALETLGVQMGEEF